MIYRKDTHTTEYREHMRGGNDTVELTALAGAIPRNLRMFSLIRLAPGASVGYHVHEKETELYYFLSGSGVADDNGVRVPISAGDTMSTADGFGHAIKNTGDEDLVFVAVIARD
jgi:mannose-6-phosphate isomerase-like protein (cupin superfamily)